jgi:hypothetical protein
MRMGDLLLRAGLISDSDLRVALAQQKQHGGKLGEHLVRVNLLTEETLARALAQQLGLQYTDLSQPPSPAIAQLLPEKVAARLQALPTAFDPRTGVLTVAVSDPLDDEAMDEVARFTGKQIVAQVTPANILRRAIEHSYFGVELKDEGTSEFQLVDIHGRGKTVHVGDDHELPELGTSELMPISEDDLQGSEPQPVEPAPQPAARPAPMRIAPTAPTRVPSSGNFTPAGARPPGQAGQPQRTPAAGAPPPKPAPQASAAHDAGDEALKMVWAIADLLIERGYFTRADLMRNLRGK